MTRLNGQSDKTQWLDKALEGSPPETKARVLEIILKYKIDPDNEFFMIFVALGSLQILIEQSPQDWQVLFENFQEELNAWTSTNLTTLEALLRNANTIESFALTSKELVTSLKTLTKVSTALMESFQTSNQKWMDSQNRLESLNHNMDLILTENQTFQQQLTHQISALKSQNQTSTSTWNWGKWMPWAGVFLLLITGFFILQGQQKNNARTLQWLLEKANRRDCLEKVLPATHPLCRGL